MKTTFDTKQDALDAGFTTAKTGGRVKDTSGPNEFGYAFTEYDEAGQPLREAVAVWLTKDMNKMRQPGCVVMMFPPTEVAVTSAAATLGRKGGQSTSTTKANAARSNGRKGGRPRKHQQETQIMNAKLATITSRPIQDTEAGPMARFPLLEDQWWEEGDDETITLHLGERTDLTSAQEVHLDNHPAVISYDIA